MGELTISSNNQLQITLQEMRNFFKQAPALIVVFNGPEFYHSLANPAYENFCGKSEKELIGKTFREIWPELEGQGVFEIFDRVYQSGQPFTSTEFPALLNDHGAKRQGYFNFNIFPVRDRVGLVSDLMVHAYEVTDQVVARRKIEENEEKLRQLSASLEEEVTRRTSELTDAQNFLQQLIDASVEFISVLDKDLRFLTVNGKYEDAMQLKREQVKGKHLFEISPLVEGTLQHESILKALKGETVYLDKRRAVSRPEYFVDTYFVPLIMKDKIQGVIIMSRDVTEIVWSEQQLQQKNRELNEAQRIAQLGSWEWDISTNEVSWSEQMFHIYGYGDERFPVTLAKAIERMPKNEAIRVQRRITQLMEEAKEQFQRTGDREIDNPSSDYSINLPDGTKKYLRGAGKLIVDYSGTAVMMIGTVLDITEQKRSEDETRKINQQLVETNEKLEQRNQFVEKLINSSLDLITVVDKELRFITLNKKAESVINSVIPGNLIGRKITEVDPSVIGTEFYDDLQRAFKGEIIIRDKLKSGISDNYYEFNYIPLENNAREVNSVMIISHDITDNILQLEELRKLNESDKLKSDFIKMASHELKTPVTSIKGYTQLLLTALQKDAEKTLSPLLMRSSLVSIEKQINRLTRLMSELLDLSKIEAGKLELNKESFNLNELVIETVQDILYINPQAEIHVFHSVGCDLVADKDRIGQVLINFLTNAVKYSPVPRRIDVEIRAADTAHIAVSVKDQGIGIDPEFHEKIFERFYRAEGKDEQTYPGFGIGLFIAKEIIQQHGGFITLESEKGNGSTFTFIVPIGSPSDGLS